MEPIFTCDRTKQNIIEAFWKLYSTGGMAQVSVTKLCKIAGYNRSTFYAHFQDVYDVLETLEEHLIPAEDFKNNLLIPLIHCQNQTVLLKKIIHFFEIYSPYLPILLSDYGDPLFRQKLLKKLTPIIKSQVTNLNYSSKHIDYILEYQNAAVLSTISKWYQNKKDIPEDELISLLLKLTSHGTRNILFTS